MTVVFSEEESALLDTIAIDMALEALSPVERDLIRCMYRYGDPQAVSDTGHATTKRWVLSSFGCMRAIPAGERSYEIRKLLLSPHLPPPTKL